MKISDIDQALADYSKDRGHRRKWSQKGIFDQRDIVKLRRFRKSLGQRPPGALLTLDERSRVTRILKARKTKQGHLSYDILAALVKKLAPPKPDITAPLLDAQNAMGIPDARDLPRDAVFHLGTFLSDTDLTSLSTVNRFFYRNTKPTLNQKEAEAFVKHAACASFEAVKRMFLANPQLLYAKATRVTDLHGRIIEKTTGYQAALAAGDDEMADWFALQFKEQGAEDARIQQYQEQLPHGWVDPELSPEDIKAIHDVFQAISDAPLPDVEAALKHKDDATIPANQTDLRRALDAFRTYFDPADKIAPRGKWVNHRRELLADELFQHHYDAWDPGMKKHDLYARQVLGYFHRVESARGLQERAFGIEHIIAEKPKKAGRTFEFQYYSKGFFIAPLISSAGMGFDYLAANAGFAVERQYRTFGPVAHSLRKLLAAKTSSLGPEHASLNREPKPRAGR